MSAAEPLDLGDGHQLAVEGRAVVLRLNGVVVVSDTVDAWAQALAEMPADDGDVVGALKAIHDLERWVG